MTLEQAYLISQIITAVVVIASILFLALQVRQNSRVLERTMTEDWRAAQSALVERIVNSREFAELHMKIGNNFDGLDDIDQYRARWLGQQNLRAFLHSVQAKLDGYISEFEWQEVCERVKFASTRKNFLLEWSRMKNTYPKKVQDTFEEIAGLKNVSNEANV